MQNINKDIFFTRGRRLILGRPLMCSYAEPSWKLKDKSQNLQREENDVSSLIFTNFRETGRHICG